MDLAEAVMAQLAVAAHKTASPTKERFLSSRSSRPPIQITDWTQIPDADRWQMLGGGVLAQFLGMTLWFSATAVTPLLIDEFNISQAHAPWLTMAVQAGFVAGTLLSALSNIADVLNSRTLMFVGSLVGAAANAAVLVAPGAVSVIALRFLTGASLALVYPPAMKIAAGWFRDGRGLALGLLDRRLDARQGVPTPARGAVRRRMAGADAAGVGARDRRRHAGAVDRARWSVRGRHGAVRPARDPPNVLSIRGARLAMLGYLGHMWELYAMWTWVVVFAWASLTDVRREPTSPPPDRWRRFSRSAAARPAV